MTSWAPLFKERLDCKANAIHTVLRKDFIEYHSPRFICLFLKRFLSDKMRRYYQFFLLLAIPFLISYNSLCQECIGKISSLKFSGYNVHLSKTIKRSLNDIADTMRNNSTCSFAIIV